MITQERLKEIIDYRDGKLFWKVNIGKKIKAGQKAGTRTVDGYIQVSVDKKLYRAHRLIFLMFNGFLPEIVDHIDGNRLNNKIQNLRPCNPSQSTHNTKITKSSTSGIKGVTWHKKSGKWQAQIMASGKQHYLGLFELIVDAEKAVREKREELHGEFSRHE